MRKKFAEDDLLGRFRLKNNSTLRIDLKPTPPEQVEEVIKKMEPLIETLGNSEQSQSGLTIDWDTNEIEVPDNMPSDEELKEILFRYSKDEVPPEQSDIFKSQRHQKMLELLAKVETLSQNAAVEETQFNETQSKSPEEHPSDALQDSEIEGSLFNGEEIEMRSDMEQFQSVKDKQTAAEPKASANEPRETPTLEKTFKLDVDHEDFQERLIRILNENYSDMGEIRPHNLKSRLIEILNEEYAEDYSDEDDPSVSIEILDEEASEGVSEFGLEEDSELEPEISQEPALEPELEPEPMVEPEPAIESELEKESEPALESEPEMKTELDIEPEINPEAYVDSKKFSDDFEQPEVILPELKDASGFLSEDFNQNSSVYRFVEASSEQPAEFKPSNHVKVSRDRERFSHFQYVTSFQEVTHAETEQEDASETSEEDVAEAPEKNLAPQEDVEEEAIASSDMPPDAETLLEAEPSAEALLTADEKLNAEQTSEEHPWLKELREAGNSEDRDTGAYEPQIASEHKWASAGVLGGTEHAANQGKIEERIWESDHGQEDETSFQEKRLFGADTSESLKSEKTVSEKTVTTHGQRSMSVEEWSFVFDTLKEQIDYLRKQLEIKDHQLQNKDELIRNFQILLKNEQDKFLKLENKMEDVVLQVEERAAKKGFFSRFRKR